MSIWADTLTYINGYYSRTEIQEITGIPQSTMSYVIRDLRELPAKYQAATIGLKNLTAYTALFEGGVPSVQASLLSIKSVKTISDTQAYVKAVADSLTTGYITRIMTDEDSGLSDQEIITKYYASAYASIVESLQNSEIPISEWQDYLSQYGEEEY